MKKGIIIFALISLMSCGMKNDTKQGNRLIVTDNKYYIYYDDEVIELNKGTYITKESKIDDYFFDIKFIGKQLKDERKLLLDLAKYFPHGISGIQKGQAPTNAITLPTYNIGDKKIIDSVKLANILDGESLVNSESSELEAKESQTEDVSLEGKKIEILNANGIAGFAKKLGENLKNTLKVEYNAENYNSSSNFTYVINHKLSDKELELLINSLDIKYIKVLNDEKIKPDADVVLITGNDQKVDFPITIKTDKSESELKNLLSTYKTIVKKETNVTNGVVIKYNLEDELIAKRIASIIGDAKLEKDDTIKNSLVIISSR